MKEITLGPEVIFYGKHIDSEYWSFYPSISLNPTPHFFYKDTPLFYIIPNHKKFGEIPYYVKIKK